MRSNTAIRINDEFEPLAFVARCLSAVRILLGLLLVSCSIANLAQAQSLVVSDCQGFTRASKSVDPGQASDVKVEVAQTGPAGANPVEVTLTNTVTNQSIVKTVDVGHVVFENLRGGFYTLAVNQPSVVLTTVQIGTGLGLAASTAVVSGAVVAGGSAGTLVTIGVEQAVDEIDNKNDNSPDPDPSAQPSNQPSPQPTQTTSPAPSSSPTAEPSPQPTVTPTPEDPSEEDCDCDPDARPPELDEDEFFEQETSRRRRPLSPAK